MENKLYKYKNYYYENYSCDDFIENEYLLNNIKKRYMKYNKNKFYIIYIFYFYYFIIMEMFSSQFIKCYFRKIELSSYYINLKIKSTGNINILSRLYSGGNPDIITINNENYTMANKDTFNNFENNIINITLIWNNSITSTSGMFSGCDDIIEMDLSHFDTSNVIDMRYMFRGCSSLTSLDLSNFNTSSVTTMEWMFSGCSSLTSLDLSNFNTSSVTNMFRMFYGCSSLTSLDLSNFNTSSVTNMEFMFSECSSLTSLDLSNFDISSDTLMYNMFYYCEKLEYINLKSAKINPNIIDSDLFSNLPSKLTVCSENEEWREIFNLSYIQYINCINKESSFNINENINKIKCFKKNNIELDNPCQICGNNYFKKINNDTYINCYEYKEGYYFDDIELNYKQCYSSCKKCNTSGNEIEHNCIECKDEYNIKY